jgi:hypothetical protein
VAQAPAQVPDELLREIDEALGNAADIHDLAGEDEQRNGEQ